MNTFIIFFITIIVIGIICFYFLKINDSSLSSSISTYEELRDHIKEDLDKSMSIIGLGLGLSAREAKKQRKQRGEIRKNVRKSSSGDRGARKATYQLIKDKASLVVSKRNIDKILPIAPEEASARTKFEVIVYAMDTSMKNSTTGSISTLRDDGFANVVRKYGIRDVFSEEMLNRVYEAEYLGLEHADKMHILTQLLFSDICALGAIDTLNYQVDGLEEIQLGINGPQSRGYDYRKVFSGEIIGKCAKDSTYVLFEGRGIFLPFLGFESDTEMQRVIRNLIIDSNAGELTEKNPKITTEAVDGRRITVTRPPITDAWTAHIRKFDNVNSVDINTLYPDPLLSGTISQLAAGGTNIGVTGEMESGKTTLLRSIAKVTKHTRSIGIIEHGSFEMNGRVYFPERNVTSLRVTDEFDEDSVLALIRKMSRQVFVIGEINSLAMANLCNKVSRFASQILFSAHYTSSKAMVADIKNAKLCNGFSNEKLAEMEALSGLNFNVHIVNKDYRYIDFIDEIVPTETSFRVVPILTYDVETKTYKAQNKPSPAVYEKAKATLSEEEYIAFVAFFDENYKSEDRKKDTAEAFVIPSWVKTSSSEQ